MTNQTSIHVRTPSIDATAAAGEALRELAAGLRMPQKELAPTYFYDHRGSVLFDRITRLPEYYLLRAEATLLPALAASLTASDGPTTLVELGAGKAEKTEPLLEAMLAARPTAGYVPVDVSAAYLRETAQRLRASHPGLIVTPVVADFTRPLPIPTNLPAPVLFAFLGSTLGNFDEVAAIGLLRRVAVLMRRGDRCVLGVDLRKDPAILEAAYNDTEGVTAEFNRNALQVLNRTFGADFEVERFRHVALYDRTRNRVEMHLLALQAHTVYIPGIDPVSFTRGETIRTEISCKYDRGSISALCLKAGLALAGWTESEGGAFALAIAELAS